MAKVTSSLDICNQAFSLLREQTVSNITDLENATERERLAALWYDTVRRRVLESRPWGFAIVGYALSRGGTPAVGTYPDYYNFPNNHLAPVAIFRRDLPLTQIDFDIEGRSLLINNGGKSSLSYWYIKDEEDVSKFPATFVSYLVAELALAMGNAVTAKPSVLQYVKQYLDMVKLDALGVNGQTNPPRSYDKSRIVNAGLFPSTQKFVSGNYNFETDPN